MYGHMDVLCLDFQTNDQHYNLSGCGNTLVTRIQVWPENLDACVRYGHAEKAHPRRRATQNS